MIRQTATINNKPVEDLIAYLDGYAQVVNEESTIAFEQIHPTFLGELKTQPGKVVYPIAWTSDRQRKFVMAKLRAENNLPYQRTGNLANSWEVTKSGSGVQITVVVQNKNPAAKFVYGSLAKSNPGRFQQRFHVNTGWETMYDTTQFWLEALWETFYNNMAARLGDIVGSSSVKTRAYTTPRRN